MAAAFSVAAVAAAAQAPPSPGAPVPFPTGPAIGSQVPVSPAATSHKPRVFNQTDATPVMNGPPGVVPSVQVIGGTAGAVRVATEKRKSSYEVKVGTTDWTDTGIPLNAGDMLQAQASGTLTFADGHKAEPDGARAGWRDLLRQYPLPTAPVGALIGRVGTSDAGVAFLLGAKGNATVATSGNLFLRANVSNDLGADGEYAVKITFAKTAKAEAVAVMGGNTPNNIGAGAVMRVDITPALFANIPRRVQDQRGTLGDVVNFALVGTEAQVKQAFAGAGWVVVDKSVEDAIVHGIQATMEHKAYLELPMSALFLFGRAQDFSYARAAPLEVAAVRHHLRVWKSSELVNGRPLWVGSATHDNGFEKDERNGNVTHHIDPNIDEERDFVLASFQQAGTTSVAAYVLPENPAKSARTATGGSFQTDGRIAVMELKP